jgi:hypothetical protein
MFTLVAFVILPLVGTGSGIRNIVLMRIPGLGVVHQNVLACNYPLPPWFLPNVSSKCFVATWVPGAHWQQGMCPGEWDRRCKVARPSSLPISPVRLQKLLHALPKTLAPLRCRSHLAEHLLVPGQRSWWTQPPGYIQVHVGADPLEATLRPLRLLIDSWRWWWGRPPWWRRRCPHWRRRLGHWCRLWQWCGLWHRLLIQQQLRVVDVPDSYHSSDRCGTRFDV